MKKILLAIFCIFMLSSCEVTNNEVESKVINKNVDETVENASINGEMFIPPNFLVETFDVTVAERNNIIITIDYLFSPKLYEFLKQNNNDYYFQFRFPEETTKIISLNVSAITLGEKMGSDGQLNYTSIIKTKISKSLSDSEIKSIEENLLGYDLFIIDSDGDVIHEFKEIYYMLDLDMQESIFQSYKGVE